MTKETVKYFQKEIHGKLVTVGVAKKVVPLSTNRLIHVISIDFAYAVQHPHLDLPDSEKGKKIVYSRLQSQKLSDKKVDSLFTFNKKLLIYSLFTYKVMEAIAEEFFKDFERNQGKYLKRYTDNQPSNKNQQKNQP